MAYRDDVLADTPRWYLRLGESIGTTAEDETANNLDGTYNGPTLGATGLLDGDTNKAPTFDGTNDYIEVSDTTDPTAYTLEAWVKASTGAITARSIVVRTDSGGPTGAWSHQLRITSAGKFQHYLYDGAAQSVTGSTTVAADTIYHVVGVATNSSSMRLYVNGVEEGTPVTIGTMWTGGDRYRIGSNSGDSMGWFNGTIDEVALYTSALSAARIGVHYDSGAPDVPLRVTQQYVEALLQLNPPPARVTQQYAEVLIRRARPYWGISMQR